MPHILRSYDDELRVLKDSVVEMGSQAMAAMGKSLAGLTTANPDLCSEVLSEDARIDQQEKRIDEQGMAILLRFNPVASDLRHVLSSINICRSLERMGGHAVRIAKLSRGIIGAGALDEVRFVEPLFSEVGKVVSTALTAYSDKDEALAYRVIEMDQTVDEIHEALRKSLTQKISEEPTATQSILNVIFISQSLERIGDLAVNIAEDVIFWSSAENIRHR